MIVTKKKANHARNSRIKVRRINKLKNIVKSAKSSANYLSNLNTNFKLSEFSPNL